jgi:predicted transcriptional regulator
MPKLPRPTDAELAILRVLWERGPSTVRVVYEAVSDARETGYTTTLKLMQIMADKGLVERDDNVRPQIYRPRHKQAQTQKHLLRDFIDRAYGGSVKALVMHALSNRKQSQKDLQELEALLDRFEKEDV